MPSDDTTRPDLPKITPDVSRTTVDDKFSDVKPPPRRAAAQPQLTVDKIVRHGVSKVRPWGGATLTLSDGRDVFLDARALETAPWSDPADDAGA